MKFINPLPVLAVLLAGFVSAAHADPQLTSWLTAYSTKYARIYTSDANKLLGSSTNTWSTGSTTQSVPVYAGIQEIDYSGTWVYIRSSGLGSHVMGPWYLDLAHTQAFPNYPTNQKVLYRIPRTPAYSGTKTLNSGGAIGYFVDGVAMFNSWDAYYWSGTADVQSTGTTVGYWNRDAYVNEGASFDPNNAHQAGGQHHYHANPPALRYLLGDHVDYNSSTKTYSESASTPTNHSPILGWVADGYPIYGPYGYSSAMDATSGVRRMISGYQLRNGSNGSDNLTSTGRTTIPAWAQRLYGVGASQSGPAVTGSYTLGRYMEDNAYLGDLIKSGTTHYQQGYDFDLDEYNCRYCVTPEYPGGTYAYFVAISSSGAPVFPYNIGRGYFGIPTGSGTTSIPETVTTFFSGVPNIQEVAQMSSVSGSSGDVTFVWSSTEGGTYKVEANSDLSGTWSSLSTTKAAASNAVQTSYTESGAALSNSKRFYRVTRTALASYDSVTPAEGISSVSPTSGTHSTNSVTLTITLNTSYSPAPPPNNIAPTSVTLTKTGSTTMTATSFSRNSSTGVVTATFNLGSTTGAWTVNVTFNGPAGTESKTNGFTVN